MKNGLCFKHLFSFGWKKMTHFPMKPMKWVVITVGWLIKKDIGLNYRALLNSYSFETGVAWEQTRTEFIFILLVRMSSTSRHCGKHSVFTSFNIHKHLIRNPSLSSFNRKNQVLEKEVAFTVIKVRNDDVLTPGSSFLSSPCCLPLCCMDKLYPCLPMALSPMHG